MGKIILNGSELSGDFSAPSLLELVVAVEEKEIPEEEIITKVAVDGFNVVDFTHEDNTLVPYRPESTVEITSEKLLEIMKKSVDEFTVYMERLLPGLKEIAGHFRQGREQEGHQLYMEAMDGIKVMIELIQSMSKNEQLDLNNFSHNGVTIKSLYAELSAVVENMIRAQTENDTRALADLLDGSATDVLQKWASILPSLRVRLENIE